MFVLVGVGVFRRVDNRVSLTGHFMLMFRNFLNVYQGIMNACDFCYACTLEFTKCK